VFEEWVLRRILGPRSDDVMGNGGSCTMRSFIFCKKKVKVKQSRYTPWRRLGGKEV
jgi:hypothetical protein